jgi:16S rRNA (guanine527-N7)-methyltransferase
MIGKLTAELTAAHALSLDLTAQNRLDAYFDRLERANAQFNLTRIQGAQDTAHKHFYDSLALLWLADVPDGASVIDIGAGAGFPSIPLAIARPDLKITAVDSVGKKVRFLNQCAQELALDGFCALHQRCEDLGKMPEYREKFDLCVARAVAAAYAFGIGAALCQNGGPVRGLQGPGAAQEVDDARKRWTRWAGRPGWKPTPSRTVRRSGRWFLSQNPPCPAHFPRKAPLPAQKPIGC